MSRLAKQLIYGTFYLAIFSSLVFGAYLLFFKPEPSCFNNIQDGEELGVDCGGGCEAICLPADLKPLKMGDRVYMFRPTTDRLALLIRVQNPNKDLVVKDADYTFDLYDEKNKLVKSVRGRTFLYASEVKYVSEFLDGAETKQAVRAEFKVENPVWDKSITFMRPQINIQGREILLSKNQIEVAGRLNSKDTLLFPEVTVMAVFTGPLGQPVGVSITQLEDVAPGETREFAILYPVIQDFNDPKADVLISAKRP